MTQKRYKQRINASFFFSEDEINEIDSIFIEELLNVCRYYTKLGYWDVLSFKVLEHFKSKYFKGFKLQYYAKLI